MIPDGAEIRRSLHAAFRLARFDKEAVADFNLSFEGFWRSFFALVLVAPGYLILIWQKFAIAGGATGWAVTVEVLAYLAGWIAFPLATAPLTRLLGLGDRWPALIIATNWSRVVQTIVFLIVIGLASGVGTEGGNLLILLGMVALLVYQWFVIRASLGSTTAVAIGFVFVDLLLSVLISAVAESLA